MEIKEESGRLNISYGAFARLTAWIDKKKFCVETESARGVADDVILDTNKRYRVFLEKARVEFESIKFEFVGYMTLSNYVPNVSSYFALFIDQQSKTSAMAAVIRQKTGKTVPYYEFTSRYSNGDPV